MTINQIDLAPIIVLLFVATSLVLNVLGSVVIYKIFKMLDEQDK